MILCKNTKNELKTKENEILKSWHKKIDKNKKSAEKKLKEELSHPCFAQRSMEKNNKKRLELSIYFMERLEISSECVQIFLSLSCNLVMRYELDKSNGTFYCFSQYNHMWSGSQHGSRKYDDLQNLLDKTSHM